MDSAEFDRLFDAACEMIDVYRGPEVFLETFRGVDRNAASVYAATFCQSEVCNGGFRQFFSNSTGVLAPEAIESFTILGMPRTAEIVGAACDRLATPYPRERESRKALLVRLEHRAFSDLDKTFYRVLDEETGGFQEAMQNFISRLDAGPRALRAGL